jgi:hypothetical protein
MFTDEKWGAAAPATGYTSEAACKVDAGYGLTETAVEECQIGFYNAGQNRLPCTACTAGYTTLDTKQDSPLDCVIRKGWFYDADKALPAPCDKGSYSTGGNATVREPPSCTSCGSGYTTQEQEAESADECAGEPLAGGLAGVPCCVAALLALSAASLPDCQHLTGPCLTVVLPPALLASAVCSAGYGAATAGATTCSRCPVNTFSSGGLAVGIECTACASGTVSSKEATESSQCYPAFADPTRDYFTSSDAAAWAAVDGAGSQADCEAACGATCLQLRISTDPANFACQTMEQASGKDVSFKVRGGVDYARYTIGAATSLGKALGSAPAASLGDCETSCTANGDCEGVMFDGTTCTQITSELDPDYTGFVHVTGAALKSNVP